MPLLARYPNKHFAPCPEGPHQAVCVDVVDMGLVDGDFGPKYKLRLVFQVAALDPATGRRFDVAMFYTNSLHPRAKLRADLEQWRGQPFTEAEAHRFDLEVLVGVNALIAVAHQTSERTGDIHARVTEIKPCPKTSPSLVPMYVRHRDRTASGTAPATATWPTKPVPAAPTLPDLDMPMPDASTPAPAPLPGDRDELFDSEVPF